MISQCQRFYGAADPLQWLDMPLMYLQIYHGNISAISAAERLQELTTLQIARVETAEGREQSKRIIDQWKSIATSGEPKAVEKAPTKDEYLLGLAMLGIPTEGFDTEH